MNLLGYAVDAFTDACDRLGLNAEPAILALACTVVLGLMLAQAMFSKEGRR